LEFFNDINSEALAFIQHSGENSESRQISLAVHVLAALQNGKELLSMEQAMGTSAFADLDLSRFRAAPITHLSDLTFEGQGAFPAQG